jgi:hypothetical protein
MGTLAFISLPPIPKSEKGRTGYPLASELLHPLLDPRHRRVQARNLGMACLPRGERRVVKFLLLRARLEVNRLGRIGPGGK